MKKKIINLWTLLAALFFVSTAGAQVSNYERTPGYYTLGINGGFSYQQGDVPTTLEGYGLGLTLAKNLYYKPGSILGFDLRGRAMYAQTKGQDYLRSYGIQDNDALNGVNGFDYTTEGGGPGFVFQNNKTDQLELGLEGVIHLNRLRERTNVNIALFGGIGLDWYNVKTDQAARGTSYADAYENLDPLASTSYTKDQLRTTILDGRYETEAHGFDNGAGKLGFMPSLGVELGYQFTPKFSMGIGHKATFTKTDLFDGQQWRDNGNLTADDDVHHYTNLHMRWIIDDKSKKLRAPLVDITNPATTPQTTRNPTYDIRATVKHISSSMDIEFTVNGRPETFNFRKKDFSSFIRLQPGNNEVVIIARNEAGSDSDVVNIFYERPYENPGDNNVGFPTVDITNPPYDNFRTDQSRFEVRAELRNVDRKSDINVLVNGYEINRFDFVRGSLRANVDLKNGRNTIRIEAKNRDGFSSDEATVILGQDAPSRPPSVEITKPSISPYNTSRRNVTIEAKIYNVQDKRDIRFTVDGYENSNFDFTNGVLNATVTVDKYETNVKVEANNNAGTDSDKVVIIWEEEVVETVDKPVVTITSVSNPTVDPFNPDNCRSTVIATILNIDDRNDIDVWLNGQHFTDYNFNTNTQVFQTTVRLRPGSNQIRIKASNTAGTDEDTANTEGCNTQPNGGDAPVVNITEPRTNNEQVTTERVNVKAKVQNVNGKSDITFELNGNTTNNFSYNKFTKEVTANVTLRTGNNTVFIEAENKDGKASDQVNIIYKNVQITRPPSVRIERPRNNSSTTTSRVELIADVKNVTVKSDVDVFLNGNRINNFTFDSRRNEVRSNLTLSSGNNTIRVVGSNNAGTDEASVSVRYELTQPKRPNVRITSPSNGVVTNKSVNLVAKVSNVNSKGEISVTVNGRAISFNLLKNEVKATFDARSGNNEVIVSASNEGGSDKDQVVFVYERPVTKPPVVEIKRPSNNQKFTTPTADVTATILHVISRRSISLKVNGKSQNFNFQRGSLTATIKLKEGNNVVLIKATNKDGQDEDRVTLIYKQKVNKPTANFTSPAKSESTTNKTKFIVKAMVRNVAKKEDISLTLNGRDVKDFRLNSRTAEVTATVYLKKGTNKLFIEGRNNAGKASDHANLVLKTKEVIKNLPKVTINSISNPTVDPFDPNKAKSTIIATIENVRYKRNIIFTFNNKKVTNYNYNSRTGVFQMTVDLKKGTNTFDIKVSNKEGQDQTSRSIQFGDNGGTSSTRSRNGNGSGNSSGTNGSGNSRSRRGGQ